MAKAVDYRETLVTYLNSESLDDAARNLNITKAALTLRIKAMRKAGVNVPKKSSGGGVRLAGSLWHS
ncbi:hypothetical protein [Rhodococcus ruber]|uniref:hypothetical protein n=1 Tax=Rhodococcus ruber TaxID=1830 RepID=UPI001F2759FF|nr:hypothetical protein [Rhodococcus ruber]MCF8783233.1 hypothetical protein [Rhodococcus ruber]